MKHESLRYAHEEGHTDVCFSQDGKKFITCGSDGEIRIWSTDDKEAPVHKCIGEWALSVRQDGTNLYVATGSNDVQILSYPEGERNGILDRSVATVNHLAIAKDNKYVALACENMEVKIVRLERLEDDREIVVFDKLNGPCLSVAFCPNTKYLAASCGDGKLKIWDFPKRNLIKEFEGCFPKVNSFENASILCRIDFDPQSGCSLAYPCKDKIIIVDTNCWSEKLQLSCDKVTAEYSIVQYSPCGKFILATSIDGDFVMWKSSSGTQIAHSKHEKSVSICGLAWNPQGNGPIIYTDTEGQLGLISVSEASTGVEVDAPEREQHEVDFGDFQFEDSDGGDDDVDDEDNENAVSLAKIKRQYESGVDEDELGSEILLSHTPRPRTPVTPLQSPFMPSSTPDHLNPRYLCWNDVGIVRCFGNDDGTNKSIDVEFHNTTFHNSIMLKNFQEYTMGSLSASAVVFANSSQISIIPLGGRSKEWSVKADEYEEIILVTSAENLVAFATSNYMIRVYSIYGINQGVVSVPGPLVSMASFRNLLLIAYHCSSPRNGDQCHNLKLLKFDKMCVEGLDIGSALGPESTLQWLGFSDKGKPAMMDSRGMLSLFPVKCNVWIPFCDTSKFRTSPSDGFFVSSVAESRQVLIGIKCKGSIYPGFAPRPVMCELPLESPFIENTTDKVQMEADLFKWSNLNVDGIQKKMKETSLKIFALACKNDFDQRALEFMEILRDSQILNLAIKYSTKVDKQRLTEKLTSLAEKIIEDDDDDDLSINISHFQTEVPIEKVRDSLPLKPITLKPINILQKAKITQENCEPAVNLSDTVMSEEMNTPTVMESKRFVNPFLKKSIPEKDVVTSNPLSLIDKSAGIVELNEQKSEKRKQPETEGQVGTIPKGKQRKLSQFAFKPRT